MLKARQGDPPAACKGVFNILSACGCGGDANNAVGLLHIPGSGGTPTLLPGPSAPCQGSALWFWHCAVPKEQCWHVFFALNRTSENIRASLFMLHHPKFQHLNPKNILCKRKGGERGKSWHCWRLLTHLSPSGQCWCSCRGCSGCPEPCLSTLGWSCCNSLPSEVWRTRVLL